MLFKLHRELSTIIDVDTQIERAESYTRIFPNTVEALSYALWAYVLYVFFFTSVPVLKNRN